MPPCNEAERDELAGLLAARPVWFAAGVSQEELDLIEEAHRAASRVSHRLLLIVTPGNASDGEETERRFKGSGWSTGLRSAGDEPDPETQVYVADAEGETGLWCRLAPISFLGSSLVAPGGGQDPGGPAALGSAIILGPHMGPFQPVAAGFVAERAALRVSTGEGLAQALIQLLSPDRAARQAHRAWELISAGAEANLTIAETVIGALAGDPG